MSIKHLLARRPSPAMLVACCALFLALGGTSYAFAVGAVGSAEIRDGSISSVDVKDHTLGGNDMRPDGIGGGAIKEETLDTSKLDITKLAAIPNATSAEVAQGIARGVHVRADGTEARVRGVRDVNHLSTGSYQVIFDRDVTTCIVAATLANVGEIAAQPDEVTTASAVFVATASSDGTPADRGFDLIVSC